MKRMLRILASHDSRLPDDVRRELVDMMFAPILPVVVIGAAAGGIGAMTAVMTGDAGMAVPAAGCLAATAGRAILIRTYLRRAGGAPMPPLEVRRWERRYAWGSYGFAAVLGLLVFRALVTSDAVVQMLAIALVSSYASGVISRLAVRPVICVASYMIAGAPTLAGLATHFGGGGGHGPAAYMGLTVMVALFALAGIESVNHLYGTTLRQLLTKRDLAHQARRDPLTGLPNRLLLRDRFEAEFLSIETSGHLIAVHALDLDRFKPVNDRFGHPVGDALLQVVAMRLGNILRTGDTAARLGGDEFIVLQTGFRNLDEARALGERIVRIVGAPYHLGEHDVQIGVSVGIALAPRDGLAMDVLTACADKALYAAKRDGRGCVVVWGDDPVVPEQPVPCDEPASGGPPAKADATKADATKADTTKADATRAGATKARATKAMAD